MLANVTLELSLKPFWEADPEPVCRRMFRQWLPLIGQARQVSVMLWTADGSELLDYAGRLDDEIEWARYIGGATPRQPVPGDPEGVCLHSRAYLYRDNPPVHTYRSLAAIVATLKRVGAEVTGLPVRVGSTFDPGPEFARSSFKYERHPEVCLAETMGRASFVCCYATLHADDRAYAGFPQGIPEGTTVGTFLGRQSQHFLRDLGFDYLWLSNGFGFGLETWASRGALFDGSEFDPDARAELRERQLGFWRDFRAECPAYPLEVRGTNLTTGIDLATDAVPMDEIYAGGWLELPPPNSPWAALNRDFGFELAGYLSHIAELPGEGYPFRFYTHDPWWLNSPWLDRYGREPHDIYLPLSVARLGAGGAVSPLTSVSLLSVDDSYGELPDQVPLECQPHLLEALRCMPDEAGPLVWVYPWAEYDERTFGPEPRLAEVFAGDWMVRGFINAGLPLNSVVSTTNWLAAADLPLWRERVLVTPAPDAGTPLSAALLAHAAAGGAVLLYGSLAAADERWLELLGLARAEPLEGEFEVEVAADALDRVGDGSRGRRLAYASLLGGGGLAEAIADGTAALASARGAGGVRALAASAGNVGWVRGADSFHFPLRGHLLTRLSGADIYPTPRLARAVLDRLGWRVGHDLLSADQTGPIAAWSRHANAWYLAAYSPDTTVGLRLRLPGGAPMLVGYEAQLVAGDARYQPPRALHRECRLLVEQTAGVVSCTEQHSGEIGICRRLFLRGLDRATVRFYPEPGSEARVIFMQDARYPYQVGNFLTPAREDLAGPVLTVHDVSGSLMVAW